MRFRSAYDGRADEVSAACGLVFSGAGRTQQQFRDECDINAIVRRFGVTGEVPASVRMPTYDDFSEVTDFHTAMNAVRAAQESFEALPSAIRSRFGHDPQQLLVFLGDEANRDEAAKLGLLNPAKPVASVPGTSSPAASGS